MSQKYVLDGLRASADEVAGGLGDVMVLRAELALRGAGMAALAQIGDLFAADGRPCRAGDPAQEASDERQPAPRPLSPRDMCYTYNV